MTRRGIVLFHYHPPQVVHTSGGIRISVGAYPRRLWSSPILMYSYLPFSALVWTVWTHRLILHVLPSRPLYFFFCDSSFLQVLDGFAMPGVFDDLTGLVSSFEGACPFCCCFLLLDFVS